VTTSGGTINRSGESNRIQCDAWYGFHANNKNGGSTKLKRSGGNATPGRAQVNHQASKKPFETKTLRQLTLESPAYAHLLHSEFPTTTKARFKNKTPLRGRCFISSRQNGDHRIQCNPVFPALVILVFSFICKYALQITNVIVLKLAADFQELFNASIK
jgi:hypothetical protein